MTTDSIGEALRTETLLHLGAVLLSEESVESVLDLVTLLTKRAIPSVRAVGITLTHGDRAYTSNATGDLALTLDHAQYAADRGPCLEVGRTDRPFLNETIAAAGHRWPEFSAVAILEEVHSVMSAPLTVSGQTIGVLNIYGSADSRFSDSDEITARLLADQAAIVLSNAVAYSGCEQLTRHLQKAVETRDLIGQAKGILMARQGCSAEIAFEILRRASQRTNRKLLGIAEDIVRSIESPPSDTGPDREGRSRKAKECVGGNRVAR